MGHRGEAEEEEAAQKDGKKSTLMDRGRTRVDVRRLGALSLSMLPTVLALETSCDESAAAVVRDNVVLSSEVASQVAEHAVRWRGA